MKEWDYHYLKLKWPKNFSSFQRDLRKLRKISLSKPAFCLGDQLDKRILQITSSNNFSTDWCVTEICVLKIFRKIFTSNALQELLGHSNTSCHNLKHIFSSNYNNQIVTEFLVLTCSEYYNWRHFSTLGMWSIIFEVYIHIYTSYIYMISLLQNIWNLSFLLLT